MLCGLTESGKALDDPACRSILDLPVESSTEDERRSPHWLKGSSRPHPLDELVPTKTLLEAQLKRLAPAQAAEMEQMKRQESQFFDAMRLDMELEEKMKSFADKEKLTARVQREFVVVIDKNAKENN